MPNLLNLIDESAATCPDEIADAVDLLDRCHRELLDLDLTSMDELVIRLRDLRCTLSREEWQRFTRDVFGVHPARALMHEEPVTQRAFEKPRGYPGDAPLLDLIYGESACEGLSELGARLHQWAAPQTAFVSVRERRDILAAALDRAATECAEPRVLALACGHLREAQRSVAFHEGAISEIVAVDQDLQSLATVQRDLAGGAVTTVCASIREFLFRPMVYGTFDLIYAAGLYDYLDDRLARRLTASMFAALRPKGRLLVANFAPNMPEIGYMEAVMDWNLIYRARADVGAFTAGIPGESVRDQSVKTDTVGNIIYLSVHKW